MTSLLGPLEHALRMRPRLAMHVDAMDLGLAVWRQRDRVYSVPPLADPVISIHVGGTGRIRYGDGERWSRRSSTPGTVTFLPVGVGTRWLVEGGEVEHLSVTIGARSRLRNLVTDAADGLQVGLPDPLNVSLAQTMVEVLTAEAASDANDAAFLDSVCETLLRNFARLRRVHYRAAATASTCAITAGAIAVMERRFSEALPVATLAAAAGLSIPHFSTLFKRATGRSPHQYLLSVRVEKVLAALKNDSTPLADLAYNFGFSSQSHLNATLRRVTGMTPAQCRKQARG